MLRRGQARRRNKRLLVRCAHTSRRGGGSHEEVKCQDRQMAGAHLVTPSTVSLCVPSQAQIRISNRTSWPNLYTLSHLKSSPITLTIWKQ